METQKKIQLEQASQSKKRLVEDEIGNKRRKKTKLESTVADLTASAEVTGDITYIAKSNSLRKTAKTKMQQLLNIKQEVKEKLQ